MTHLGYILAAYLLAAVVLAGMIGWVIGDYRLQRRRLAKLQASGSRRDRSR